MKPLTFVLIVTFFCTHLTLPALAKDMIGGSFLGLPEPGAMVSLSAAYQPALLKGLTVHKDNPFMFDFLVDQGDFVETPFSPEADQPLADIASASKTPQKSVSFKDESMKIIKYFMATLAIPEQDLWVNLSPYEKDRTVPEALGQTDMGRDLLAQDYMLKQLTASLIYPEKELGKKFWDRVYEKTQAKYGNVSIPVNTFNKVWIIADKAEVYEHNQTVFVIDSHLKVMLEEDYLATNKNMSRLPVWQVGTKSSIRGSGKSISGFPTQALGNDKGNQTSQIIRDIILPELEHEINTGRNFANLRQIFNSIILATWYKTNLKQSLLNQVYSDKEKVNGIHIDAKINQDIYERYLQAYKKGVFNYIKKDTLQSSPKKYFSGGINPHISLSTATKAKAVSILNKNNGLTRFQVRLDQMKQDKAMFTAFLGMRLIRVMENFQRTKLMDTILMYSSAISFKVAKPYILEMLLNPYDELEEDIEKKMVERDRNRDRIGKAYINGFNEGSKALAAMAILAGLQKENVVYEDGRLVPMIDAIERMLAIDAKDDINFAEALGNSDEKLRYAYIAILIADSEGTDMLYQFVARERHLKFRKASFYEQMLKSIQIIQEGKKIRSTETKGGMTIYRMIKGIEENVLDQAMINPKQLAEKAVVLAVLGLSSSHVLAMTGGRDIFWDRVETWVNYLLGGIIVGLAVYLHNHKNSTRTVIKTNIDILDSKKSKAPSDDGEKDAAMKGGIDLMDTGSQLKRHREGNGVEFNLDAGKLSQIRRDGIAGLTPVITQMFLIVDPLSLVGLNSPVANNNLTK